MRLAAAHRRRRAVRDVPRQEFQKLLVPFLNAMVARIISVDMADVPKSLYRRYLEVSEATFQAQMKIHSAADVHHYKPILNISSPHKGFEGCLPCRRTNT
jgi:hypothetical protein